MTTTTGHESSHAEHTHDVARSQRLAVILLIAADGAFVFGLVFTYFYLRGLNTSNGWIGAGDATVSPFWNWLIAALVVASALIYQRSERRARNGGDTKGLITGTRIALAIVAVDLIIQIWRILASPGTVGDDAYNSIMVTMGAAHVFHLLLTLFAGVAVWLRTQRGLTSGVSGGHPELVGYWWTWVAVSAVIIAIATSFVAV